MDVDGDPRVGNCRVDIGIDESPYFADCNENLLADACEAETQDCNNDLVPDECQLVENDCNLDSVPDDCGADCNDNGVLDLCELEVGNAPDCNGNEVPDECDLVYPGRTRTSVLNSNAGEDEGHDNAPRIASFGNGRWLAVWQSRDSLGDTVGSDLDVLYAQSLDDGLTWTAPTPISCTATTDSTLDRNARVAADRDGHAVVVWRRAFGAGLNGDAIVSYSHDYGETWSAESAMDPFPGLDHVRLDSPLIETDGQGRWMMAWAAEYEPAGSWGKDGELFYAISDDAGVNWSAARPLNADAMTDDRTDYWPALAAVQDGTWCATWGKNDDIHVACSTDSGQSWSAPIVVSSDLTGRQFGPRGPSDIAGDGNGRWMVVWACGDAVCSSMSLDNGETWSQQQVLHYDDDTNVGPIVAADESGNWMVSWHVRVASWGGQNRIAFKLSRNDGASWTPARLLTRHTYGVNQNLDIVIDPSGQWMGVWSTSDHLNAAVGRDDDIMVAAITTETTDCNGNASLDVDLLDFASFQIGFTGPRPAPDC